MNRSVFIAVVTVAVFGLAAPSRAQSQSPLVGAWERVVALNAEGQSTQPPASVSFLVFSPDGFFSQSGFPTGRSKVNKPLDQMTKEELLERFNRVDARRGTWTVKGDRLIRMSVANADPNQEGAEQVQLFRIEGGMLILNSPDPKQKTEFRFKRAK